VERQKEQQEKTHSETNIAKNQYFAAVENVSDVTRGEEKHNAGEELCETDKAEIERAFGDLINLPANSYGLHFESEHDEAAGHLKKSECRIAERSSRIVLRVN
jgi:hypothetical protein